MLRGGDGSTQCPPSNRPTTLAFSRSPKIQIQDSVQDKQFCIVPPSMRTSREALRRASEALLPHTLDHICAFMHSG